MLFGARVARERGIAVPGRLPARIVRGCDRLLVEAMKVHEDRTPLPSRGRCGTPKRRKGRNLALRLQARRDETLRFLTDAPAPFADNEAERGLRMMKRRQKISGGFRSRRDADDFAILRSVIATAQKQRRNVLKTPMGPPKASSRTSNTPETKPGKPRAIANMLGSYDKTCHFMTLR